jgi:uncharacterized delta-60 repeat protein
LESRLLFAGGDFDTTFGFGAGYITSKFNTGQNDAFDVTKQSNGLMVVGGSMQPLGGFRDAIIVNYNGRGKFNSSFGAGGMVKLNFGASRNDICTGVALQSDGQILGVGTTYDNTTSDIWIGRYNPDGRTDKTFNGVGYRRIDLGGYDYASKVMFDSKAQKILVVGSSANFLSGGGLFVARYNLDGSNDNTFGTNGVARSVPGAGKIDAGTDIYRTSDKHYIMAGARYSYNDTGFTGSQAYLWKTDLGGHTDTTFGTGGWQITPFGRSYEFYNRVSEGPNGKVYAAGTSANGVYEFGTYLPLNLNAPSATQSQWAFGRYSLGGALDSGFNGNGKQTVNFGTGEVSGLGYGTVQSDGSIVAGGGSTVSGQNAKIVTARVRSNGTLDPLWGMGGWRIIPLSSLSVGLFALRMFTGGEIYGVGHAKSSGSVGSLMLSRYQNTGTFSAFSVPVQTAGTAPMFSTKPIDDSDDDLVY